MFKSTATVFMIILMLVLAGCNITLPSADDAQQTICEALQNLAVSVDNLANVEIDANTDDVKELKARLDTPIQRVRSLNERLDSQALTDLLAAYDNATSTIDELPDGQPIGEDLVQQLGSGAEQVQAALGQATSALDCAE